VRTFDEWLDYVRDRLDQATRLDPWRGLLCASGGMGSRSETFFKWCAVACVVAAVGLAIVLRGRPWWAPVAAVALALLCGAAWIGRARAGGARELARRQAGGVALGALVMANEGLFDLRDARDLPGVVLVTRDDALMRAPARLIALADRLFELKDRDAAQVPAELRAIAAQLTSERGWFEPMAVPRSFCGGHDCALFPFFFRRRELPHPALDRRLFPLFADRDLPARQVQSLPKEVWWREDVDDALAREFGRVGAEGGA